MVCFQVTRRNAMGRPVFEWQSLYMSHRFTTPFPWVKSDRCFKIGVARNLAVNFPTNEFSLSVGREGRYQLQERTIIEGGLKADVKDLASAWQDVIDGFLSKRYGSFVQETLAVDLTGCSLRVRLYRYNGGDWMLPHTDPPDRVTTHLCYLAEDWRPGWGGELLLLRSANLSDIACVVPPAFNTAVLFCPSATSYHAVRIVASSVQSPRLAIIAQFVRSLKAE